MAFSSLIGSIDCKSTTEGLISLKKMNIYDLLKETLLHSEYRDFISQLSMGIKILLQKKLFSVENVNFLLKNPSHAVKLAYSFSKLSEFGVWDDVIKNSMINHPQCVYYIFRGLVGLLENDVYTEENQHFILSSPEDAVDISKQIVNLHREKISAAAEHSINGTQKKIIEATFNYIFSDLKDNLDKSNYEISLYEIVGDYHISEERIRLYKYYRVWETMQQARAIMSHACPQNRSENYPYFQAPSNSNYVVYKNTEGKAAIERRGLLSLTSRNDNTADPITKYAVRHYVYQLVEEQLRSLRQDASLLEEKEAQPMTRAYSLFHGNSQEVGSDLLEDEQKSTHVDENGL